MLKKLWPQSLSIVITIQPFLFEFQCYSWSLHACCTTLSRCNPVSPSCPHHPLNSSLISPHLKINFQIVYHICWKGCEEEKKNMHSMYKQKPLSFVSFHLTRVKPHISNKRRHSTRPRRELWINELSLLPHKVAGEELLNCFLDLPEPKVNSR